MPKMLQELEYLKEVMLAVMSIGIVLLVYRSYTNKEGMCKYKITSVEGLNNPFDRYNVVAKDKTHVSVNRWKAI